MSHKGGPYKIEQEAQVHRGVRLSSMYWEIAKSIGGIKGAAEGIRIALIAYRERSKKDD